MQRAGQVDSLLLTDGELAGLTVQERPLELGETERVAVLEAESAVVIAGSDGRDDGDARTARGRGLAR